METINPKARIRRGHESNDVFKMTEIFVELGLMDAPQYLFDEEVENAVYTYQLWNLDEDGNPLKEDGIPGFKTLTSLNNRDITHIFDTPVPEDYYEIPDGGTLLGRKALEIGLAEMAKGAGEVGGNNRGPFVEKYFRKKGASGAWCAGFASWCFEEAAKELGIDLPFKTSKGAQGFLSNMRKEGLTYDFNDRIPQPGDVIVWWRGKVRTWKGHIGIVHHFSNGVLYVLEGNRGAYPSRVRVYKYVLGDIDKLIGFAKPEA